MSDVFDTPLQVGVHRYVYCRVSTVDQDPQLQRDALKAAGCNKLFENKASGTTKDHPQLIKCTEQLREGDPLVVWKLDRRRDPRIPRTTSTTN